MQHYLLFDSGCQTCSSLAQLVADESQGWLEIRSLREPAMQELLNRARPGWKWEPTLLALDGAQVDVFTGLSLRIQMVRGLGLRQAGRIAQLIAQFPTASEPDSSHRRHFLKVGGAVVGGLALGLGIGLPKASLAASETPFVTDATPLASTDPVIALMKKSRHVRLAKKHFGSPDWSRAFRITHGPKKRIGYAVFFHDTSLPQGDAVAGTVLIFGHELQARDTLKRAGKKHSPKHPRPLVFRMTSDAGEQAKVEWFRPTAKLVAVSKVTSSADASEQLTLHLTTVTPNAQSRCLGVCGNQAVKCLKDCEACRKGHTLSKCATCLLCVGSAGMACYKCLTNSSKGGGGKGGGGGTPPPGKGHGTYPSSNPASYPSYPTYPSSPTYPPSQYPTSSPPSSPPTYPYS